MKEDSLGFLCGFEKDKHVRPQGIEKVQLNWTFFIQRTATFLLEKEKRRVWL